MGDKINYIFTDQDVVVIENDQESIDVQLYSNSSWFFGGKEYLLKRLHSDVEGLHFPYPVSLLSFEQNEVLTPRNSVFKKWASQNQYGDPSPLEIRDYEKYRYYRSAVHQAWIGYMPKYPIPELDLDFSDKSYSHGEVELVFNQYGLEVRSPHQIVAVVNNVFV